LTEQFVRFARWYPHSKKAGQYFENMYDEHVIWGWILNVTGVVVEKERNEYSDFISSEGTLPNIRSIRKDAEKIIQGLSSVGLSPTLPADKIKELDSAAVEISALKNSGFRVGAAFGVWDLNHPGHTRFLNMSRQILGKYGKLIVCVSSDSDVKILKGRARPIFSQEERATGLAHLPWTDLVIPLPAFPHGASIGDIDAHYGKIHEQLSPHLRLVGKRESTFENIRRECENAGTGLLYWNNEILTSTSEIVQRILDQAINAPNQKPYQS